MKATIAQNAAGFIGRNNRLPWQCKADLLHFARLTAGATVLVGYNTLQGLPQLHGRTIVQDARGAELINTENIDWCIGGRRTYEKYAHLFTELHVSTIQDDFTQGDTVFPTLILPANCTVYNYFFRSKSAKEENKLYLRILVKQNELGAAKSMLINAEKIQQDLLRVGAISPTIGNLCTMQNNILTLKDELNNLINQYQNQ
jgi:dihydrofolate reductase